MTGPGSAGENRLIEAVCMLVERYIQQNLPPERRGIRPYSREQIRGEVKAALNEIVARLILDPTEPPEKT